MGIVGEKDFIEIVKNLNPISFKPGERKQPEVMDSHDYRYLESGEFGANLHIHTCHSDGSLTIDEFLKNTQEVSQYNPKFLAAITDHDTIEGSKEAYELIKNFPNINVCLGIEISTVGIKFPNQPKPLAIHLLVYGINPFDKKLNEYLNTKRDLKLQLSKDTIVELNKNLSGYNFNLEEAAKCHPMIAKGQDEVAHPLKKYTTGKILLDYYFPKADFSYEQPIYEHKYLFATADSYHITYKKALENFTGMKLPVIPDDILEKIHIAKEIYTNAHPRIGKMLEPFSSFEETVEFVTTLDSGVMSIAHPARTKAYTAEFYTYLFKNFKEHGKDKAMFYEGGYQSYEGRYALEWKSIIERTAAQFNLSQTGGLDSHGKNIISRCPHY